jgi:hypothetical protein
LLIKGKRKRVSDKKNNLGERLNGNGYLRAQYMVKEEIRYKKEVA